MAFDEPEETKLIDISELQTEMAADFGHEETAQDTVLVHVPTDAPTAAPAVATPAPPIITPKMETGPTRLAHISERFIAGCVDTTILWYLYWAAVQIYRHVVDGSWNGPAPMNLHWQGVAFHAVFGVVALLYYFPGEGIFSTTIGKVCCGMSVRQNDGRIASLTAVFLRTLFRPLDYLLGPITLAMIELTSHHQRLGDLIANTVVIKRQRAQTAEPVAWEHLATSTGRLVAGGINLCILIALLIGSIMLLSPTHPFLSQWIILAGPGVVTVFLALLQTLTQTTPGGWCCGYRIVQENGLPIGFTHAMVRTLLLPIDVCCGALAVILAPRRQRIGDMIAGTLVVRAHRTLRGCTSLASMVGGIAVIAYVASQNPAPWINRNLQLRAPVTWINPDFQLTFVPRTELFPDFPTAQPTRTPFRIAAFRFAEGTADNTRSPAVYVPGETAYFVLDLDGFRTKGNMVWVQQDLAIRYPDNSFGLRQENIIDSKQMKRVPGPLVLKNSINLPQGLLSGKYTVFITLRDKFGGGPPLIREETFYIKERATERRAPTSTPAPPTALPAPE